MKIATSFIFGILSGFLIYEYFECMSWLGFVSGLVLGVLSNFIYSFIKNLSPHPSSIKKLEGQRMAINMVVDENDRTMKLATSLFKYAQSGPSVATKVSNFIELHLTPEKTIKEEEPPE